MKKVLSLVLVLVMVASMFVGCSNGSSDPVGFYKVKSVNGQTVCEYIENYHLNTGMSLEDALPLINPDLDKFTMELKSDGTAVFTTIDESFTFNWRQDGSKIIFSSEKSEDELVFKFKNGELSGDIAELQLVMVKSDK